MIVGTLKILLVEDNPWDARLIREMLAKEGKEKFEIDWVTRLTDALERLGRGGIDAVLLDLGLPDSRGLDTFGRACAQSPQLPFLVLTGLADEDMGVKAVRQGAQDYLIKGELNGKLLLRAVRYAIERKLTEALEAERKKLFNLLDNLPAVVHLRDANFKIPFTNRLFRAVFGDPGDRPCYAFLYGRNLPCENCAALEVLKDRVPQKFETSELLNGRIFEFHYYPFAANDGSWQVLTLGIDISERKRMEEALKESEDNYRLLVKQIPAVVFKGYPDWSVDFFDDKVEELTGYPKADFDSRKVKWCDLILEEDLDYAQRVFIEALKTGKSFVREHRIRRKDGRVRWVQCRGQIFCDMQGKVDYISGVTFDITDRKQAEEALEKRLIALSRPLDDPEVIDFNDMFNMDDIQQIQDLFAKATGVASIITHPDGTPITKPSNFCRLCIDIIRQTELGLQNCYLSDALIGRHHPPGPILQPCLSGGLWDAGASITVGGKHLANWLIGQVRNKAQSEENMREYARKIGANEKEFIKAFYEVPTMSENQFKQVADALFSLANQLSAFAYQNVQQARFITELRRAEEEIKLNEARLASLMRISQYEAASVQDLLDYALEEAIALTGSKIGYIYLYDETTQQFTLNTWSKEVMQACAVAEPRTIYQLEETGIWGEAVRQARPIMVNDFQAPHPLKKGYPEGHAPLYTYLTIPVISGNRIVAVLGVANKDTDYDDADVRQLTLMMDAVWKIVERQRAERSLSEQFQFLQLLIDTIPSPIFYKDVNGVYLGCNQSLAEFLGRPKEEIIGKTVFDTYPKDQAEKYYQMDQELFQHPGIQIYEFLIERADGTIRNAIFSKATFVDISGKVAGLIGVMTDITERKQAEEELRISEARLASAQRIAHLGHWEWDIKSCKVLWSEEIFHIFGLDPEKFSPNVESILSCVHPEDETREGKCLNEALAENKPFDVVTRVVRPDGSVRYVQCQAESIFEENGRPQRMRGTARDITAERLAEKALKESEKNLRFLAIQLLNAQEEERKRISRELHDELGHALLTLKLNLRSIERGLYPDQQALADNIESLFHYIDEVIENVRRLYLDLAPGDIENLGLTTALQILINEYAVNNQAIQWSVNLINIDNRFTLPEQTAIYRIFQEILTNIGKHAAPTLVSVNIEESDSRVLFEVRDNGRGFTRGDGHQYSKNGMGLLAIEERLRMLGGLLRFGVNNTRGPE